MVNEETINNICMARGMLKLSISATPTWVDKEHQEGIELKAGKVKPFWIVGEERNYDEPAGEKMRKTLDLINIEKLSAGVREDAAKSEKEPEKVKEKIQQVVQEDKVTLLELPEFLTSALMLKWAEMKTIDRMLVFQRTPKSQIFQKKVGKDENGVMQTASYVKGNYMIKEANAAFLYDWKFMQQGISIGTEGVCVYGIIGVNIDGKTYSRPAVGYEEINKKMTAQLAIKSATTDAIKKGLSLFGFNSDVYSGEV